MRPGSAFPKPRFFSRAHECLLRAWGALGGLPHLEERKRAGPQDGAHSLRSLCAAGFHGDQVAPWDQTRRLGALRMTYITWAVGSVSWDPLPDSPDWLHQQGTLTPRSVWLALAPQRPRPWRAQVETGLQLSV